MGSRFFIRIDINPLAERLFQKDDLDKICTDLSPEEWINPHRSILGLGNYDVNVLMKALQTKGCEAEWFDKRKDPSVLEITEDILGFIMNVPSDYKIGFVSLPLQRRHWISVRKVGRTFYSFDSKLKEPLKIGDADEDLVGHLRGQLDGKDKELFIVRRINTDTN